MKDKDLLKLLYKDGWTLKRVRGSHHVLQKGNHIEVIPVHGRDLPIGLLDSIVKRTGVKVNRKD